MSQGRLNVLAWESGQMVMLFTGQYGKMRNLRVKIMSLSGYAEFEALVVHLRVDIEESLHFKTRIVASEARWGLQMKV